MLLESSKCSPACPNYTPLPLQYRVVEARITHGLALFSSGRTRFAVSPTLIWTLPTHFSNLDARFIICLCANLDSFVMKSELPQHLDIMFPTKISGTPCIMIDDYSIGGCSLSRSMVGIAQGCLSLRDNLVDASPTHNLAFNVLPK